MGWYYRLFATDLEMILGNVNAGGEAVVTLLVRGLNGHIANVQAVVDTGFTENLTLPPWVIERLKLAQRESDNYLLADGSKIEVRRFVAEVEWLGTWQRVLVVETESNPLLGMALMSGHHLGIDIMDGGRVEIRPLSS